MEKKVVNLEDWFSEDNEENGVWASPEIEDVEECPFEFLVTGSNAVKNVADAERYSKKLAELEDIKDLQEKAEKRKDLDANRMADFIAGMRVKEGYQLNYSGKEFAYSKPLVVKLLRKSPLIQAWLFKFVYKTANFINRKKESSN